MCVSPDNRTLIVAESFANQLTAFEIQADGSLSNRRVWAALEGFGPDGICLDAEGAVWTTARRVREGGDVLQTIPLDHSCFACMLGGEDKQTLFLMVAEWRGPEHMADQARTGQVLTTHAPAPGVGWP
jgi:sugar lactone lactonase YvrE